MEAVANKKLNTVDVKWKNCHSGCLVLSSAGYPGAYEKGKENFNFVIYIFN